MSDTPILPAGFRFGVAARGFQVEGGRAAPVSTLPFRWAMVTPGATDPHGRR
jgi:beta-glucosidase/6-phospho-beta-glucosidase/beta-galactosidase